MTLTELHDMETTELMDLKTYVQSEIAGLSAICASRQCEGFALLKREHKLRSILSEIAFVIAYRMARRRRKKQQMGQPNKLEPSNPTRITIAEARASQLPAVLFRPGGKEFAVRG
jgi:hypothetical protein